MRNLTRRELLKKTLATAGAAAFTPEVTRTLGTIGAASGAGDLEALASSATAPLARERLRLDPGWRFLLGHAADPGPEFGAKNGNAFGKAGDLFPPSSPNFDDSSWRAVDLPHDWAVDLPFVNDPRLVSWGFKPLHRAYPETSVGWYRKTFALPASDAGRRLAVEFDGVFRDCMVALNGHLLGRNLSGYVPFRFDVTDVANYGANNVLVVRVDASDHEGWFYEGAGIYRHAWLVKTNPLHVAQWGTYIRADVGRGAASLRVVTEIDNDADAPATCRVVSSALDPAGKVVATVRSAPLHIEPWSRSVARDELRVDTPQLWSPESPRLYTLVTTVDVGGVTVDRYETPFGIRTVRFDADRGFLLNGQRVEIKGTCNHQDHAGVGAALPDRLQSYRIERLKEMGCNAYRTSHNMPTAELLDACDRLGMLVLDETRTFSSTDEGLSQLERLLRRDRNRPSVIAWSIANEEWNDQGTERGARIATAMKRLVRQLDPSRPVTAAMDQQWGKGTATVVDVMGFNYHHTQVDAWRATHPRQPAFGTEVGSTVSTRGVYVNDKEKGYVSAYDVNAPSWASLAEAWWPHYAVRPWIAGGFVWTGFDYRGEPTPYEWPCINSHFGILDICGFPKDNFYYYQAWWSDRPVLHLFPHWNWAGREGKEIDVWCHTNLDRVELFLNGRSLGVRDVARNSHAAWKVPYAPGTLEARGYRGGSETKVAKRETTGPATRIILRPDRDRIAADGEDVSVVAAQVVDPQGRVVPTANDEITFTMSANGRLLGVGNGDPSSHESDRGPARHAFNGLCVALVQASREAGVLAVQATAPGLEPATVGITCYARASAPARS